MRRVREAYKLYEELVFSGYHKLLIALQSICQLAKQEKDMEMARLIVEKQTGLVRLMEIGRYQEAVLETDLAMAEKDIEATLQFAQKLLSAAGDLTGYSRSRLYEHMEFREPGEESLEKMRETLVKCLREEAFGAGVPWRADERRLAAHIMGRPASAPPASESAAGFPPWSLLPAYSESADRTGNRNSA